MGYVYLVTNKINGKRYVGQSQQLDIEQRWKSHRKVNHANVGSYLKAAYKKYGIINFKFQIICICFDEDCDKYEDEYINKFNTLCPNGYNLKTGGNSIKYSEESKKRMSIRQKEIMTDERRKLIGERFKGKTLSEQHRQRLSTAQKNRWINMSSEDKDKLLQQRRENPNYAKDKIMTAKSYAALQQRANSLKKRVGKFDKNNNLLESFDSLTEAARTINTPVTIISRVCSGKKYHKTAGGFIWKYI
jgi:group I intron endonuclease